MEIIALREYVKKAAAHSQVRQGTDIIYCSSLSVLLRDNYWMRTIQAQHVYTNHNDSDQSNQSIFDR